MNVTSIIVFLISVVAARHHHRTLLETILKSRGNLYTKVNDDVQNVMNNLFDALNLETNFHIKSRIKLFLTMHYDLKSIAEKNFEIYEKIVEAAKPGNEKKNTRKIELFELIEEILDAERINLLGVINGKKHSRKHTKQKKTITTTAISSYENMTDSVSDFADSLEFMEFIRDFIKKVDNLTEKDFAKQSTMLPDEDNSETESNLKVWEPPRVLELDYVNDTNSRRIFMGKRTRIKHFPFIVSIHFMGTFSCAGSIISQDLVITAASCLQLLYNNRFYRENPRSLVVRIGSDYYARGGERIEIIEIYFHPSYDPKTLANNLVILRLHTIIRFRKKQKKVRRILFDRNEAHLPTNTEGVIVVGWGSRKQSHIIDQFGRLLVAQLDVYDLEECSETYSKLYVSDKHFCAGFISSGGGACNKDLGGPGIVSGKLVGVISFGAPVCGTVDSPTVFIKLGYYADWIDSIMDSPSTRLGVRTTLAGIKPRTPFNIHVIPTTQTASPVTAQSTTKRTTQLAPEPMDNEILTLQSVLGELAKANTSFLRDILYGESDDDDVIDMFKTTKRFDPLTHPLVNKSIFTIPTFDTKTSEYVTIPLTTSPTHLPLPPQLTEPTGTTTLPPSRVPTTTEGSFTDLDLVKMISSINFYDQNNNTYNESQTRESPNTNNDSEAREGPNTNNDSQTLEGPKEYYSSYEENELAADARAMRATEADYKQSPEPESSPTTTTVPTTSPSTSSSTATSKKKIKKKKKHHRHHHHHRHHSHKSGDIDDSDNNDYGLKLL